MKGRVMSDALTDLEGAAFKLLTDLASPQFGVPAELLPRRGDTSGEIAMRAAAIRAAAPRVPPNAMDFYFYAWAILSADAPHRARHRISDLALAIFLGGMAVGRADATSAGAAELSKALSRFGAVGGVVRHEGTAALKEWALNKAATMKGSDKDKARELRAQLPAEFESVSKDPERLIYDALMAARKPTR